MVEKEKQMNEQKFPSGWDETRVKNLILRYQQMDEAELVAEDEAAHELEGQTLVRELIARKTTD